MNHSFSNVIAVPRPSVADRLPEVVDAAVQVFSQKGYEATQMADIASVLGMGAGALYNYVEGKEGLFALCIERLTEGEDVLDHELALPVAGHSLEAALRDVREAAGRLLRLPRLDRALEGPAPADAEEELTGVVRELYGLVGRTRRLADMVERSARDTPALAALFYEEVRAPLLRRLETYLQARIDAGALHTLDDVGAGARFVVETVAWFARHRFHDIDGWRLDERATEATVVDLIVRAFLPRGSHR